MDTMLPIDPVLISRPVPVPMEVARVAPAPRPAPVYDLAARRGRHDADLATLRLAAHSLAESARALAALAHSTRASVERLGEHRATLLAEAARGRRIAAEAEAIERAILSGDLGTMLALRARLAEST